MQETLFSGPRTYGDIEWDGKSWLIKSCEPHVSIRLKQLFPRIPKTEVAPFKLTGGPQLDADLNWFMLRYPFRISQDDLTRMQDRKTLFELQQREVGAILAKDWKPSETIGFRDGEQPYDYQAQAAEIAIRMKRLLLMDDVGLGKTVSACATLVNAECLPAAVVVQSHLGLQWKQKIEEFTHLRVHEIKGTVPYELPPADVYIFRYSNISGWIDFFETSGFKSVVYDEVQELRRGSTTAKGKAAESLSGAVDIRLGLSATPIYNYGSEIFNVMHFIEPGALGQWHEFVTEWCSPGPGGNWVVSDPRALGTYLQERLLVLKRSNEDVGEERKPVNVIMHDVPLSEGDIEIDDKIATELAETILRGSYVERGQAARKFDMLLRKATGVGKAPHVAAYVQVLVEAGHQVVLFGWHRDVYDIWLNELAAYNPILYTGSETPPQKARAKKTFESGLSKVLIISLRSGAGLDGLQKVSHVAIFGELDWSPQVHQQCIGRLWRPGQKEQVDAIYLHATGGSDPTVINVLGVKASQSYGIINPLEEAKDQHSDDSRIKEMARRYLETKPKIARIAPPVVATPKAGQLGLELDEMV